jgi:riboflavin synthase
MFTGIIREVGVLHSVRRGSGVTVLEVHAPEVAPGLAVGDSIAVNGVCLTVTVLHGGRFRVDVSPETRRATTAGGWRTGTRVHLEPALRASDRLGGHFVLGHVDDVGRIDRVRRLGAARQVTVAAPPGVLAQLLPKGSVAVDGVSLTLDAGPFGRTFTVTLIPETLRATRLSTLGPGDAVNLEVDVLAKGGRGQTFGRDTRDPAESREPNAERRARLTLQDIRKHGWR